MEFIRHIRRLKTCAFSLKALNTCSRRYCASSPIKEQVEADTSAPVINQSTINKLEQLSLLNFNHEDSLSILEGAIKFTEDLRVAEIDENVEPMYSPSEKESIPLREDRVEPNASRKEILKNAAVLEEEYFVAPLNKIS